MAIILNNNKTRAAINSSTFQILEGLCRESTIVINKDGSVSNNGILNLGFSGDNLVTVINIDTSNLNWGTLDDSGNVSLKNAYQPKLIFKDVNNTDRDKIAVEFEGNYFLVPESVTSVPTTYEIIYTLQERLNKSEEKHNDNVYSGNVGPDTAEEYQEIFISTSFKGVVHASYKDTVMETKITPTSEGLLIDKDYKALHKEEVLIDWIGESGLTTSNKVIGQQQDSLITPLVFKGLPKNETFNISICFSNKLTSYIYNLTNVLVRDDFKLWVPKEITQNSQTWLMGFTVELTDSNKLFNSNTVELQVINNFLDAEILDSDVVIQDISEPLLTSDNEMLIYDEDGNPVVLESIETTSTSYTLSYTGQEVNTAIWWVKLNKTQIEEHLSNNTIHITQDERELWNNYDKRIKDLDEKVSNISGYNEEVLNQINTNTENITTLQDDLKDLADKEANDITILTGRVIATETNYSNISAENQLQGKDIDDLKAITTLHTTQLTQISGYGEILTKEINDRIQGDLALSNEIQEVKTELSAKDKKLEAAQDTLRSEFETYVVENNDVQQLQDNRITQIGTDLNDFKTKPILKTADIESFTLLDTEEDYLNLVANKQIISTMVYFIKEEEE